MLSWALVDKVEVHLQLQGVSQLDQEMRTVFSRLAAAGIKLFELPDSCKTSQAPLVAQLRHAGGVLSLFSSLENSGVPGPTWLTNDKVVTWVASTAIPELKAESKPVDTSSWGVVETGAVVIKFTNELDGPLAQLPVRLKAMLSKEAQQLLALLESDKVKRITYSDRYLRSPWTVSLLSSFLQVFKGEALEAVLVKTAESSKQGTPGFWFHSDWLRERDQSEVVSKWISGTMGNVPVTLARLPVRELQHGRELTIDWVSGAKTRILLDQGMGYWLLEKGPASLARFDFGQSVAEQIKRMGEVVKTARMLAPGKWPTYMTIVPKVR
jgi:hypothetical protein